jgi:preprotein translocase subunit SecG
MYPFVVALHVLLCVFLLVVILLQPGKGADVGSAFGGGGAGSMFGPRGPVTLLTRATTVVAVLFMVTSVTLSIYSNRSRQEGADVEGELERLRREQLEGQPVELTVPDDGGMSTEPAEDHQE